jgi:hypothetical protein
VRKKLTVEDVLSDKLKREMNLDTKKHEATFERGKFDDFLVEVLPFVSLLGDLYRQTRKM